MSTVEAPSAAAPQAGTRPDLVARLLRPRSIAVVGYSAKPGAAGATCLSLLERDGYSGAIHLVGRSGGSVGGRPVLGSIDELPHGVDLAVLALPAVAVLDAVRAGARRSIATMVIFASGFAETGDDARAAQAELSALAEEAGIGLVGPNCLGYANFVDGLEIGFLPGPQTRSLTQSVSGVAIVAQSGGLMGHLAWAFDAHRVPVAYRISAGNEAGLGLADYVDFLTTDAAVTTIVLYAEHIRQPARFLAAARAARAAGKHVVLMHTGRGRKAQTAAASHTGALAGDHKLMSTLVSRAGVLVVDSVEELVDCTEFLVRYPVPPVLDPAIATTSGALCAIAHDTCDDLGIALPPLASTTYERLAPRMPDFTPPRNPFDLSTQVAVDPMLVRDVMQGLFDDPAMGSVTVIIPIGTEKLALAWAPAAIEVARRNAKPFVLALMGDDLPLPPAFHALLLDNGVLVFRSPERALRAVARMTAYGRALARPVVAHAAPVDVGALPPGPLAEWQGKQLLRQIGIAVPQGALAATADDAARTALRIGYPVALKIQSATLTHKTEIGGVLLNVADEAALRQGYAALHGRAAKADPGAAIDGVLVEAMAGKGLEIVVGAKRDPQWGPVLLVGLGGVLVEALGDVRLLPTDLDTAAIADELRRLQSARLLDAFRGAPARDVDAIAGVVAALGGLMAARPDIVEVDINPLLAFADGQGVLALDALVVTQETR